MTQTVRKVALDATTLAALETINAIISDGGATISIDDGAASITVDGTVALDSTTLAALETINAVVSGTVALDSTALAALETIELGGTSLAALESITVVGALTDAELRASPVPVSGTVSTGGLTDTQLRATPVPVEQATSVDVADGGGSLTVDGPATDAQLRATPLPVSGTVSTGGLTDTQLRATPVPISVDAAALAALETTELGATTLAALETINAVISDGGGTITVDDGAASLTVDGTVALDATTLAALETVNAVISGEVALDAPSLAALETIELGATSLAALESITATGPLTDTQLRATPVPVSGTVTTGGLTDTQLRATPVSVEQATSVDVADGGGSLTVDSPQLPSVLATDRLKVDGSGVTQPVSGTVTANAGSGTQAVSGPLTDAQLRASVVPVDSELTTSDLDSGGGTDTRAVVGVVIPGSGGGVLMSQPATDAQLRATPLPVSGTVTASGPLTDAQLAARLPLSVEQATSVDIADGGGSITVDAPSGTPVRTDPTGTTAQPVTDNAGSLTVDNAGTFAVQDSEKVTDNAGFTDGTTKVVPGGYIFDEAAGTALTENDAAAARIDSKRAQVSVIEDETTRGRRAAVTAANALKVDASGVAVPITDNAGSLTVDSPGLPAALDGVSLKVKEQSPLAQGLTDTQLRASAVPVSVDAAALAALETTELGATTLAALESVDLNAATLAALETISALAAQQAATTGTITTSSSTVGPVACTGYQSVLVSIQGTYAGVSFAVQIDPGDGNFYSVRSTRRSTGLANATQTPGSNAAALYVASIAGATNVQVKASAYTSGTANVRIVPVATPVTDDVVAHLVDGSGFSLATWGAGAGLAVTLTDSGNTLALGEANTAPLFVRQQTVATSAVTNVAASASNVTLKASNANRRALYVQNDGTSTLYVKLGATATATTSYSAKLAPGAFWELPGTPLWTGIVDGIWTATGGNGALVTELT